MKLLMLDDANHAVGDAAHDDGGIAHDCGALDTLLMIIW